MAREDLHFRLRIPEDLKKQIEVAAEESRRSMTAEIVSRLEQSFLAPLTLPDGLMERIRTYADRHGRTVTDEIVRVLEREFPQQWDVDDRMKYLAELIDVLRAGTADARIGQFIRDVRETVEGVISGRVTGVSEDARDEVAGAWDSYLRRMEAEAFEEQQSMPELRPEQQVSDLYNYEYDDEEKESSDRTGRPVKFAIPRPKKG